MSKKLIEFLSKPIVVFYALGWLMVLVIVGTIAQRYIGLYQSQMKYFSSFIWWLGPVPVPGGYPTLTVIFLGLTTKLVFKSKWRRENLGTIVTHIGALSLLFGGFLTAAFSYEGGMVLPEGETSGYISDYNDVELAIIDRSAADHDHVTAFEKGWLHEGKVLRAPALPFEIQIMEYCRNCQILKRKAPVITGDPHHGFAANFQILPAPLENENERNQAGVVFYFKGPDVATNGVYSVFENMPVEQTIEVKGVKYSLALRRAQTHLPFKIHLLKFTKGTHPGTDIASLYKSEVMVLDGGVEQRVTIQMNEPLRYKGYTLYQASFVEASAGGTETSVLAVVHNMGRVFPYISSLIMCIGLLLHLILQIPKLIRGKAAARATR